MLTPWKIIFNYKLSGEINSQIIYDEIFKLALAYQLKKRGLSAMLFDNKTLTNAIFGLNSQDKINVPNNKIITGQELKELFVTTIFLRHLETKFDQQSTFFIDVPFDTDNAVDTAIMVIKPNTNFQIIRQKEIKLPEEHYQFLFQIKEYSNFQKLKDDKLTDPTSIDIKKLGSLVDGYSDHIIVFMRDFSYYDSKDLKEFFEKNPKCFLISFPGEIQYIPNEGGEYKSIALNKDKHNYIITFPKEETFATIEFSRPKCLIESSQLRIK